MPSNEVENDSTNRTMSSTSSLTLSAAIAKEMSSISKALIRKTIHEVAKRDKHPDGHGTQRWVCKPEALLLVEKSAQDIKVNIIHTYN